MKKKRVLHIGSPPPPIGGMSIFFQQLLESDVNKVFDGYLVRSSYINKHQYRGMCRYLMNFVNGTIVCFVLFFKLIFVNPSIVHIQTNSGKGFFEKSLFALIARLFFCKVIMHVHGGGFGRFYDTVGRVKKSLIRFCLSLNHRIVVLSDTMRQIFIAIGVASEKICIVENGVFVSDKTIFDRKQILPSCQEQSEDLVTVLFLNRITEAKGVFELIDAAEIVLSGMDNVRFNIVGPGDEALDVIKRKIEDKGLTERVRILDAVVGYEKEDAYLNADIYVLPSYLEGLPIGMLEAMNYCLACIVTPVGGVPGVIENNVNGVIVPVKDVDGLAEAIEKLCANSELRFQMGKRARTVIEERFSWSICAKTIIDLYNSVLE